MPNSNYDVVTAVIETGGIVQAQILDANSGSRAMASRTGSRKREPFDVQIHNEGAVGDRPKKLVAVYMVERGHPLIQPVK